jgi:hypothetical protein
VAFHAPPHLLCASRTVIDESHSPFVDFVIFVFVLEARYLFIGQELPSTEGYGQVVVQTKAVVLVQINIDASSVSFLNL